MPRGGDNGEGPAEEKPMDGLSRLGRANERAEKREVLAGKKQLSDKARKNLEDMSSSSSDGEKSS